MTKSSVNICGLALLLCAPPLSSKAAQSSEVSAPHVRGLPPGAVVLEQERLPETAHRSRLLVLWMQDPQRHPKPVDEPYTCPELTRGSYYSAPTRVSLVDGNSGVIINTVRITIRSETVSGGSEKVRGDDSFDIPYRIERGHYRVDGPLDHGEGKPKILDLKDYNDDGRALEFALFSAQTCSDVAVQLIGYSVERDRVIQYPFHSKNDVGDETWFWANNLFAHKRVSRGHWHYTMQFPGATCVFDFRYVPSAEEFLSETSCH